MEVTIVGIVMLALWCVALLRGVSGATFYTLSLIPFGTAAALNLTSVGGLSVLGLQIAAALTTGAALVAHATNPARRPVNLPPAAIFMLLLCLYGAVSAYFLPRLFFHQFHVIYLGIALEGVRVSDFFYTLLNPIAPTTSNISQPAYLFGSTAFFLVLIWMARVRGPDFLTRALALAAIIHIVLGVLDSLRLEALLSFIRTAHYALNPTVELGGFKRIIGGFSEASSYGAVSVAFAVYFSSLYLDRSSARIGALAGLCIFFSIAALSSTGTFGLALMAMLLAIRGLRDVWLRRISRERIISRAIIVIVGALVALFSLLATPVGVIASDILETLIFSKGTSLSGMERAFWAEQGFRTFWDSYGLGAGLGSVRANGLPSVLLANVGLPGAVLFLGFLWYAFLQQLGFNPGRTVAASAHWAHLRASFAAAMVMLGMQAVSSTTLDPGILFFTFAAIAIVAREGLRAGRRATLKEQRARAAAQPEPMGAPPRQRPGLEAR